MATATAVSYTHLDVYKRQTHYLALKYGPIVLAARISDEHLSKDDFRSARSTVAMKDYPVIDLSLIHICGYRDGESF